MAEPIIQLIFQDRILETIKVTKSPMTVGRMTDNDVVINNLGVSRRHCQIIKDEAGNYFVEDMGSANGIRVNGVQVQRSPLFSGDEIVIGKHKLVFQLTERGVAGFFRSEEDKRPDIRHADRTFIATPIPTSPQASAPPNVPPPSPETPAKSEAPVIPPELEMPQPDTYEPPSTPPEEAPPPPQSVAKGDFDKKLFEYVLKWSEYGLKLMFEGKVISVHALKKPIVTIGRAPESDVVIDNLGVSRLHAKITKDGEQYFIEDQGSANGIRVNGVLVKRSPLYPGDEVQIGKHILVYDLSKRLIATVEAEDIRRPAHGEQWQLETYALIPPVKETPPAAPEGAPEAAPSEGVAEPQKEALPWEGKYAVRVTLDGKDVTTYALTKKVTCIGRLKENDIVIDNLGVSRLHAKIIIEENGQVYVEDQESANGIIINGLAMRRSPLYPGDEIVVVKHKLVFELSHKAKPQQKAVSVGMTTDPWSQDSTMMVSEADKERLMKQWAERAAKEKAEKESKKEAPSPKPQPPAKPASQKAEAAPQPKKDAEVKKGKFYEPTPPMKQALGRVGQLVKPDGGVVKMLKPEFVIGSSDKADIKITGSLIKPAHVVIKKEDLNYRLIAKGLFKRPKVNGKTVSNALLNPSDTIAVGDMTFTFRIQWEE